MGWRARARVAFIVKEMKWGCWWWCDVQVAIGMESLKSLRRRLQMRFCIREAKQGDLGTDAGGRATC